MFFVLSICNLKKIVCMFFSGIVLGGTTYCRLICLAESWKHFLKSKTAFVCFLIQRDTGETAFWLYLICPSTSIQNFLGLNRQFLSFDSFSLCSFPPTLSIDFIAGTEILAEVLPSLKYLFFSPEYTWVDLCYSLYVRFDLKDGKVRVICPFLFIIKFLIIYLDGRMKR